MRLVDLCPYGVYPPRAGGHRVVHHVSACLAARHDVLVFAMGLRRFEGLRLRSFVQRPAGKYVEYRHVTPLTYLSYLRRRRTGLPPLRASAELRWTASPGMRREIAAADVIQVEHPWQFAFARRIANGPIVMVAHNAEATLLERRGFPRGVVARAGRIERAALTGADAVIFLSSEDRSALAAAYDLDPTRWHTCGIGVDTRTFRPASEQERTEAKATLGLNGLVALFAGSWHLPNRSAVEALREVAEHAPAWTFVVVGSVGRPDESTAAVRVTGTVSDVLPYFRAADVALNPMTEGSGVNIKVLEYMAAGLPTVTTRFGMRGLDVGNAVLVADVGGFPEALEALGYPAERSRRAEAGREVAESRFTWEAVANARERIYAALLAARRQGQP